MKIFPLFCLDKISKNLLSRYLDFTHAIPLVPVQFEKKVNILNTLTINEEPHENENVTESLQLLAEFAQKPQLVGFNAICRQKFCEFLADLKYTSKDKPKLLLVDAYSKRLLNKLVDWIELKKANVFCVFTIDEQSVSNILSQHYHVVYLISLRNLNELEFRSIKKELSERKARKIHIYLTEQCDLQDKIERKQAELFSRIANSPCKVLGVFNVLNEHVALIDSAIENFRFLLYFVKYPCEKALIKPDGLINKHLQMLSIKLATLLAQCAILPHIRYFNSFHLLNKWFAKLTFDQLQIIRQNQGLPDGKKEWNRNYLLLIVDRTIDLVTPLIHSTTFEQFVTQELELAFESDSPEIDRLLAHVPINQVTEKLIEISKKLSQDIINQQTPIGQLEDNEKSILGDDIEYGSSALRRHFESANRIKFKLQEGYKSILTAEQEFLQQRGEQETEQEEILLKLENIVKRLKNRSIVNEIGAFDVIRLFAIHILLKEKAKPFRKMLKQITGNKLLINKKDANRLETYVALVQKLYKKSHLPLQTGHLFNLEKLINDFNEERLEDQFFFNLTTTENGNTPKAQKLLIFVIGGISFNEIHLSQLYPNVEIVSDSIIYPRLFFETITKI